MIIQHKHLLVRAEVSSPPGEFEIDFMHDWFNGLVKALSMKIMSGPHVEYCRMPGNRGITGVCIIESSHISFHGWDEVSPGLLQIDVYTCGDLDPKTVFQFLDPFDPVKIEYKYLDREHDLNIVDANTLDFTKHERVA